MRGRADDRTVEDCLKLWQKCDIMSAGKNGENPKPAKEIRWIGSAKDDLSEMPVDVKYEVGALGDSERGDPDEHEVSQREAP